MKTALVLCLAIVPIALAQKEQCSYPVDIIAILDTSDTNIARDDTLGASKRALQNLLDIHDIGTRPDQSRFGLCIYGDDAELVVGLNEDANQNPAALKRLIGDRVDNGFSPRGGFDALHVGIRCGIRAAGASRPGRQKLMVLLVVANDLFTEPISLSNITAARDQGIYVSTIAVGPRFVRPDVVATYPSSLTAFSQIRTFREFEEDSTRFRPTTFDAFCPADLITTTTTTTTTTSTTTTTRRPPPSLRPAGPCDNCIIVNGVGYASTEDCFSFYQCILQDDETWLEFRRPVAVGAFWSQERITGDTPLKANCPADPCIGRPDGAVVTGYSNCRAFITCAGGVAVAASCCGEGEHLVNGQCVPDNLGQCLDICNDVDTTPGICYLSPDVDGNDARFMANDGDFSMSMPCPIGTIYSDTICGCVHVDGEVPIRNCRDHPEVQLAFGPDGQVLDISRNKYSINTENFSTRETAPGSGVYAGVFNGTTKVRISNANIGLDRELTLVVDYQTTQSVQNAAVVSDAECADTFRTLSIIDDNAGVRGFLRTVPDDVVTVTSEVRSGRKRVVLQHNDQELVLDTNGQVRSQAAGALLVGTRFCDGIKLGFARDLNGFVGEIFEFELYKCLSEGTQDFQRGP